MTRLGIKAAALVVGAVALAGFSGCGNNANSGPTAVCTTGMVADVVRNVAGDRIAVDQLMKAGVDPHLYDPNPGDARKLENATLIFYSGLHLEGKMTQMLEHMAKQKPAYAITDAIDRAKLLKVGEAVDPHVWFDVELWAETVDGVRDALTKWDPEHAGEYKENASRYKERLLKLHRDIKKRLKEEIPDDQRVLVTAHDAFEYFGRAYGVEVHGLQGISTDSATSLSERKALADLITRRKIKAIFVESSVSEKNIRALIEDCAFKGHKVVIGGELFSDAMGELGTPKGTYEGMILHNVGTIINALK